MKPNFASRAKAIETTYGVDSGTTRKLLKELYDEQKKFAVNNPNMVGDVPITGKGLSTNDFMDLHGNMDLNLQQKKYLNESKSRDEVNESGAYKRWQEDVLNLQNKKASTGFNDSTKYPVPPPRFGQQPARIPTAEVEFANGGKVSLQREIKNGIEVEREHAPTLEFVKNYFAQNGQFPTVDKFAKSIMSDHEGDFRNISNNPQQSYYQRLIENNLSDEKSKYALGGEIKPVNLTDADIAGIRMMAGGGSIHIKPENVGKFTEYKRRTGKTTSEALHSSDPHVRQMANFARNAAGWKHADGGSIFDHPLIQQLAQQRLQQKYGAREELPQIVSLQSGQRAVESTPPPSVVQSAYTPIQQKINDVVSQANTIPPNVPYLDLIKKYFKEDQWSNAARVMMGESAGNAKAFRGEKRNPGGGNDSGLFQFNSKYHPEVYSGGDVFDPEYNIKSAAQLHSKQGWKPWVAAKKYNIGADSMDLNTGNPPLTVPQKTKTDQWIEMLMQNAPQFAPSEELFKTVGNVIGAPINYATGTLGGQDAYSAAMPVLGATGRGAKTVEDAMNKAYRAEELAGREAATASSAIPPVNPTAGESQFVQESMAKLQAEAAANAKPRGKISSMASGLIHPTTTGQGLKTAGVLGAGAYGAYKLFGDNSNNPGIQSNNANSVNTPTPFQIPNMNYSTQYNPNYYDSTARPQETGDVGVYAKKPARSGNLSPLQPKQPVLSVNTPNELAPIPDFIQLHPDAPRAGFDYNNLMRIAPVLANLIPGRRPSNIPNDLMLPRVNAQKFAPDYLSTAPVTEQLGSQYRTGVDALSSITGGSASAMRSGLQGLNRATGRSAGEALTDIYGKNIGLKNSATQYNLENVNKVNMFNAEMGAKEALSRKDMDITNKELSQGFTNQEQQRRAAAFTQLGQIGKENVQNKLAERIYGYSADGTKITDPKKIHQVVYKNNPKTSKSKLPVVKSTPVAKYVNRPEQDIASMRMNYNGQ
jgi:hypothetical protein